MAIQVDVKISAEELIRALTKRYTDIVSTLVRENALTAASLDQMTARVSELEAQLAVAQEGTLDVPAPEQENP